MIFFVIIYKITYSKVYFRTAEDEGRIQKSDSTYLVNISGHSEDSGFSIFGILFKNVSELNQEIIPDDSELGARGSVESVGMYL